MVDSTDKGLQFGKEFYKMIRDSSRASVAQRCLNYYGRFVVVVGVWGKG